MPDARGTALTQETSWQRTTLTLVLTPLLTAAHFVYGVVASLEVFRLAGGIQEQGNWTTFGGIAWSGTNLAWLPGGLVLPYFPIVGLLLLLAGSFLVGLSTATVTANLGRGRRCLFGPYGWRLWALSCWLVWVPVPVKMTVTYWHTVAY
jgi:hypothetical protein